jgi:hypothetical protein
MKRGEDEPYVGYIIAPYEEDASKKNISDVRCFWIDHHEVDQDDRGVPMLAEYTDRRDGLGETEWDAVRDLIEYYEVYPQRILMSKGWSKSKVPRLKKLRDSLQARLNASAVSPAQAVSLLDYISDALTASDELHQTALVNRARQPGDQPGGPTKVEKVAAEPSSSMEEDPAAAASECAACGADENAGHTCVKVTESATSATLSSGQEMETAGTVSSSHGDDAEPAAQSPDTDTDTVTVPIPLELVVGDGDGMSVVCVPDRQSLQPADENSVMVD